MTPKQFSKHLFKPLKKFIAALIFITIFGIMSFPFIWIWVGFSLAWKVGLSSLIANGCIFFFNHIIEEVSEQVAKKAIDNPDIESKFQTKLKELIDKRKTN